MNASMDEPRIEFTPGGRGEPHMLRTTLWLPLPPERVFDFFARAENLARITPAELGFQIRTPLPIQMMEGALIDYTIRLWGMPMRWRTRITRWSPPDAFIDEQLAGPYAEWIHLHEFAAEDGGTRVTDTVRYALPFGPLGALAHPVVRPQLRRIFTYRQRRVPELLLGGARGGR